MKKNDPAKRHEQDADNQAKESSSIQEKRGLEQQAANKKEHIDNAHQHNSARFSWRFWLPNIIQIAIALFAFGTLTGIYFQWGALRGQSKILVTQTELLQQQMIHNNRAWVTLKEADHTKFKEGKPVSTHLVFINSGNSPALSLTINSNIIFSKIPIPTPIPLKTFPIDQDRSRAVVGPQGKFMNEKTTDDIVTKRHIIDLQDGKEHLYVWGRLEYDDIFGQHRHTDYCMFAQPDTLSFVPCWNNNAAY